MPPPSQRSYLLPGLTVGEITRDSVKKVFLRGIVASQLINYLEVNAHPMAPERIPIAVSRQIEVWEDETKRIAAYGAFVPNLAHTPAPNPRP
jgi:transcription initiation factor TFIIH subunit 4